MHSVILPIAIDVNARGSLSVTLMHPAKAVG